MGFNFGSALSGAWGAAVRQVSHGYGNQRTPQTAAASYRMQRTMPITYGSSRPKISYNQIGQQSGWSRGPVRRYALNKAQVFAPEDEYEQYMGAMRTAVKCVYEKGISGHMRKRTERFLRGR